MRQYGLASLPCQIGFDCGKHNFEVIFKWSRLRFGGAFCVFGHKIDYEVQRLQEQSRGMFIMRIIGLTAEIAMVAVLIIAAVLAIPIYNRTKDKAREFEVKQGLHDIQMSLGRYWVDMELVYPSYLIGGDAGYMPIFLEARKSGNFDLGADYEQFNLTDPLLNSGYLTRYPRNPFFAGKRGKAVLDHQCKVVDPLRPGAEGDKIGYRFGEHGDKMGNVMPDQRFDKIEMTDANGYTSIVRTYADFTAYPYYDIWADKKHPKFFLQGEFFYKSYGTIVVESPDEINPELPIVPVEADRYVMGAYGAHWRRGSDILGQPPKFFVPASSSKKADIEIMDQHLNWFNGKPPEGIEDGGCPYMGDIFIAVEGYPSLTRKAVSINKPNGIPDAIILVLDS